MGRSARADRWDSNGIGQSQGTSPATAAGAGIAALWLSRHGRDALITRYRGSATLQDVFRFLLRKTATIPFGWKDQQYGAGIANAAALLAEPLPSAAQVRDDTARMLTVTPSSPLAILAGMTGLTSDQVICAASILQGTEFSRSAGSRISEDLLAQNLQELCYLLANHRARYLEFTTMQGGGERTGSATGLELSHPLPADSFILRSASASLRSQLKGGAAGVARNGE